MPLVADAAVAVRADMSKFAGDLKKGETATKSFGGRLKDALNPMALLGGALAGGFAITKVIGFLGDATRAARDLAESQSKVNVVFAESADEITAWAEDASSALLMSRQKALESAGTFGNLFQAFGLGREESTQMSKSLVQLAADLASFNNTSVDDALLALRSGLSGETEPLKRFGIAISDARLRTELANLGFKDLGATLTPLQKSTASYALILKDSALAQGDVARTSGGLANQQRELQAAMDDFSADVGTLTAGPMTQLIVKFNEWLDLLPRVEAETEAAASPFGDFLDQPILDILHALGFLKDEIRYEFAEIPDELYQIQADGEGRVTAGAHAMAHGIAEAARNARQDAVKEARAIPGEVAAAMLKGMDEIDAVMAQLQELLVDEWTDASRIAYLEGQLITAQEGLAGGIAQGDSAAVSAAQEAIDKITAELALLKSGAYAEANASMITIEEVIRQRKVTAGLEAAAHAKWVRSNLAFDAEQIGINSISTYAQGLRNWAAVQAAITAATHLRNRIGGVLAGEGSPWYTLYREIGETAARTFGESLQGGIGELSLPISGMLPAGGAGGMSVGDININAPTVPMTPTDIGRELRRTGVFGVTR